MNYDGYNVDYYDYTSDHDGGKRYGVIVEDLRRFSSRTLSGYTSIPERDAAVREWIEQQEQKPVIVAGPVVRSVEWGREFRQRLRNRITDLEHLQSVMAPYPRDWYDDDANHEHSLLIYRKRLALVTELIGSYRREIGAVLEQLEKLEHGG